MGLFPLNTSAFLWTYDRIAYERRARGAAGNVYAVASEACSAESHTDAAQVHEGVLESGTRGRVGVSELAIHACPLVRRERYRQGDVSGGRLQIVSGWACPPAIELLSEIVIFPF